MKALRIVLFSGLVLHKAVWVLYSTRGSAAIANPAPVSLVMRAIKSAKTAALLFLSLQTLFLNIFPMKNASKWRTGLGLAIYSAGLSLAIAGRVQLGNNWANIEDAQVTQTQALVRQGVYRYIRHPIYAGDMLLLIGLQLALNSRLVFAMLLPVLVAARRAAAEEKLLAQSFSDYPAYEQQTKRFIPFLY